MSTQPPQTQTPEQIVSTIMQKATHRRDARLFTRNNFGFMIVGLLVGYLLKLFT